LLGFNTYGADGVFGPRTRSAIAAWQGASGYRADGYLPRRQFRALREAAQYAETRQNRQNRQRRYQQRDYDVLEGPVEGYYDGPYYRGDGSYNDGGGGVIIPGYWARGDRTAVLAQAMPPPADWLPGGGRIIIGDIGWFPDLET